jgi:hypothetical protein
VFRQLIPIALIVAGCSGPRVISILPAQVARSEDRTPPLSVVVDATNTHLPLAISGANLAYGDVDRALSQAIERALVRLSAELAARHARRLELAVELIDAHAEYSRERLVVRLTVRATLRENAGNVYVAQTHARASASAVVAPERGATVVSDCDAALARQLSGWLDGMELG